MTAIDASSLGLPVDQSRRYLEALRFGFIRLMELSSGVLVRTTSTQRKLDLSRQIWALAQCAGLIGDRLPGLRSQSEAVATTAKYAAFTDAVTTLRDPDLEYEALTQIAYPDLRRAVIAHQVRVPGTADELTVATLEAVLERLDAVPPARPDRTVSLGVLDEALARCGGVAGGEPGTPPQVLSALPVIPVRPGRAASLREGEPGAEVSDGSRGSILHDSIFRVELCATEICAALLAHHPEAPWALRYDLAKQVRDEARHFELFAERMHELGVVEGDYPLNFDVWDKFILGETLPERIMIEQRLGEGTALDGAMKTFRVLRKEGDFRTLFIFDYVIADEITHVGNGNRWLRELTGSDEGLDALDKRVRELLATHGLAVKNKHPVNVLDRALAGFTEAEIQELRNTWERERALIRVLPEASG